MKWQISPSILHSKIDDEVILMSIEADSYFGLDPIASRIWELLEEPKDMDELVALLTEEYEVDDATCRADVQVLLDDLVGRGLVEQQQ
jgi:hypothetical protein